MRRVRSISIKALRIRRFGVFLALCFFVLQFFPPASVSAGKSVKVGTYQNKPLVFADGDGKVKGMYPDILGYIAEREGWTITYVHCVWKKCLEDLESGKIDVMVAIAYTLERAKRFNFNRESVLSNWGRIYVNDNCGIKSILDMNNKIVAYIENDIYYTGFREHVEGFKIKPIFIPADDYAGVLELVNDRSADAGIVSRLFGQLNEQNYDIERSNIIFTPTELRFAVTKNENHDLINSIDHHLGMLKNERNSFYFLALNKWIEGVGETSFPKWLKWTLATGGGLLMLFFAANVILRSQVRSKTDELLQRNRQLEEEIAERRKAEDELSFRKSLLESQNEASIDGVLIVDERGSIIFYNRRFIELWDVPEEVIITRSDEKTLNAVIDKLQQPDEFLTKIRYLYGHREEKSRDEIILKDGRCFERYSAPVRNPEGIYYGRVWIFHDISDRKKLERELLHIQKMEAIGTLAGGIAHDFNNILNVIIGYADIMRRNMRNEDPLQASLHEILTASERATHLTHSLLAFSRKQIVSMKPVKINELVSGVRKMLARIIGEDVQLKTVLAENELLVMADYGQIEQVLINLATNARDAMSEGGEFTVSTGQVELGDDFISAHKYGKPGTYVRISAVDTGSGMDEKTRDKIFEPFFTTKEFGKGTGLGLSIVYGIIKQHYGFIDCTSKPGEGTEFVIYLPVCAVDEAYEETVKPSGIKGGAETILVAEDDIQVRRLMIQMLEEFGYAVIVAEDADDAMKKFLQNKDKIQLVILDVIMPGKSGKEVGDEITRINPGLEILYISGYSADIIERRKILDGREHFISKPVSSSVLLKKVREMLDEKEEQA